MNHMQYSLHLVLGSCKVIFSTCTSSDGAAKVNRMSKEMIVVYSIVLPQEELSKTMKALGIAYFLAETCTRDCRAHRCVQP
jgi:hypothetical protein